MKKRIVTMLLCLAMGVGIMAGCGSNSNSSSEEKTETTEEKTAVTGGSLAIPIGIDMKSFNYPAISGEDDAEIVLSSIYDPLCTVGRDEIRYYLAESCEMSEDATTLTVKLRDDIFWHDGEKITADDIIYTIEWLQNPDTSKGTDSMRVTIGGQPVSTEKIDDRTVKVTSAVPQASLLYDIGELRIMPKHIWEDESLSEEEKNMSAIGSGPYTLDEYISGEKVVVKKNEDYYRTEPSIDTIEFKIIPDFSAREIAFKNGEINLLRVTDEQTLANYKDNSEYIVYNSPEGRINYLTLGNKSNLSDIKAREAVVKALNIEEIVQGVYGDDEFAVPANSMFSRMSKFYIDDYVNYEQDIETSEELVEETGLNEKKLTYIYNSSRQGMEETALMIQQQLKEVGVEVELKGVDAAGFFTALAGGQEWDLLMNGYPSKGEEFYGLPFYSTATANSMGWYVSDDVDESWNEMEATVDEEVRKEAAAEGFDKVKECYSLVPVSDTNYVVVMQSNYEGWDELGMATLHEDYTRLHMVE